MSTRKSPTPPAGARPATAGPVGGAGAGGGLLRRVETGILTAATVALPSLVSAGLLPAPAATIIGAIISGLAAVWHVSVPAAAVLAARRDTRP